MVNIAGSIIVNGTKEPDEKEVIFIDKIIKIMTSKLTKEELKKKIEGNELDLSICNLAKVPVREMLALPKATNVDLSRNSLLTLPDTFCSLKHITRLDLSNNSLSELPENFGLLENLKRLDLFSNNLSSLPTSCCNLTDLQWLDLKNNPIQTLLPEVVGDCLKPQDCKQCARNMLHYLKVQQSSEERKKQIRLEKEREQKEKQLVEDKKEKELRRRSKQQERQQKREAYEAMKRQKKLMAEEMNRDLQSQEEFMETRPKQEPQPEADDEGGILSVLLILLVVTILVAIGLAVFCHHDNACRELLAALSS